MTKKANLICQADISLKFSVQATIDLADSFFTIKFAMRKIPFKRNLNFRDNSQANQLILDPKRQHQPQKLVWSKVATHMIRTFFNGLYGCILRLGIQDFCSINLEICGVYGAVAIPARELLKFLIT